jgi:hypothetical protein
LTWILVVIAVAFVIAIVLVGTRRPKFYAGIKPADPQPSQGVLQTRPLASDSRARYVQAWNALQSRFAEDPEIAIRDADHVLQDAMRECGYPTGDFGRVSEVVTTEQVDLLEHYRAAHRLSVKGETTVLSDEEVQHAMTALRAVYDILFEEPHSAAASPEEELP